MMKLGFSIAGKLNTPKANALAMLLLILADIATEWPWLKYLTLIILILSTVWS